MKVRPQICSLFYFFIDCAKNCLKYRRRFCHSLFLDFIRKENCLKSSKTSPRKLLLNETQTGLDGSAWCHAVMQGLSSRLRSYTPFKMLWTCYSKRHHSETKIDKSSPCNDRFENCSIRIFVLRLSFLSHAVWFAWTSVGVRCFEGEALWQFPKQNGCSCSQADLN